jgi:hypothetical protein
MTVPPSSDDADPRAGHSPHEGSAGQFLTLTHAIAASATAPLYEKCNELVAVALSGLNPTLLELAWTVAGRSAADADLERWAADW